MQGIWKYPSIVEGGRNPTSTGTGDLKLIQPACFQRSPAVDPPPPLQHTRLTLHCTSHSLSDLFIMLCIRLFIILCIRLFIIHPCDEYDTPHDKHTILLLPPPPLPLLLHLRNCRCRYCYTYETANTRTMCPTTAAPPHGCTLAHWVHRLA